MKKTPFILSIVFLLFNSIIINSQNLVKSGAPKVFFDCHCDLNYIREQIPIINYVNDRTEADIHILFTDQRTGSGGREYLLLFVGQRNFAGMNDTIKYNINQIDSEDLRRAKMVDALKAGLTKYIFKSPVADRMKITFTDGNGEESLSVNEDDWDSWVIRTSLNTSLSGQQTAKHGNIGSSVSVNRVTEESKIYLYASLNYNESNYDYGETKISSISRRQNVSAIYIGAISSRWSWGFWSSLTKSTYSNLNLALSFAPGIEYNFFPYSEANQRQFRIEYRVNMNFNKYALETIYMKIQETLFNQILRFSLELIEPWGNAGFRLSGSNYLHDFNLYSLSTDGFILVRLLKGFSLDFKGGYSKINNQLALPRGQASLDEILLARKEIATQYSYNFGIGVSYSFGSIYNNAVNSRFGD
ncbi:MAG: hypothetical protein GYA14_10045 [Ignavibacteria bacterium]|nr:hypothetical protein [Ignavibacteria bacterium]